MTEETNQNKSQNQFQNLSETSNQQNLIESQKQQNLEKPFELGFTEKKLQHKQNEQDRSDRERDLKNQNIEYLSDKSQSHQGSKT